MALTKDKIIKPKITSHGRNTEGKKEGNNIIIHKDSFELILTALATQKFVGEAPPNGDAMAMGKKKYNTTQKKIQKDIDNIYQQAIDILHKK